MVLAGAVQVAADLAGVAWRGSNPGEGGQCVRGSKAVQVAADSGQKFRPEHGPDSGEALDNVGQFVASEPLLDEPVDLADPLIEGNHLLGQGANQLGDGFLCWHGHLLALGCLNGPLRERP